MAPQVKALFIMNPNSRSGRQEALQAGIDKLQQAGIELIVVETTSAEHTVQEIKHRGESVDLVIVVGGDGTLHSVAGAMVKCQRPLAILPAGTANDLARSLDIPDDIDAACDVIINGKPRLIDLGSVNGEYFFNAVHLGLGVEITHELTPELKQSLGVFSYLKAFSSAISRRKSFRVRITLDGRPYRIRTIQVGVGNGRFYGGGNVINELARIDDGQLWLYSIKPQSVWELLTLAPLLRGGRHRQADRVFCASARCIEIETSRAYEVHADGEPVTRTPLKLMAHPGVLEVMAPVAADLRGATD